MSATDDLRALLTNSGFLWADVISKCKRTLWLPDDGSPVVCYFDELPNGLTSFIAQMATPEQAVAATIAIKGVKDE